MRLAIIVTCMLVDDLCNIALKTKVGLDNFSVEITNFIKVMSSGIKNEQSPITKI